MLIIASLIGYLEWSGDSSAFLFQAEGEVISKLFTDPASLANPFVVLPLLGQFILVYTLFQKRPNKLLTYISIGSLGILLGFMFIVGLMSANYKIVISTLPFLIVSVFAVRHYRKVNYNSV